MANPAHTFAAVLHAAYRSGVYVAEQVNEGDACNDCGSEDAGMRLDGESLCEQAVMDRLLPSTYADVDSAAVLVAMSLLALHGPVPTIVGTDAKHCPTCGTYMLQASTAGDLVCGYALLAANPTMSSPSLCERCAAHLPQPVGLVCVCSSGDCAACRERFGCISGFTTDMARDDVDRAITAQTDATPVVRALTPAGT